MARPIPELPPVTSATLPSSEKSGTTQAWRPRPLACQPGQRRPMKIDVVHAPTADAIDWLTSFLDEVTSTTTTTRWASTSGSTSCTADGPGSPAWSPRNPDTITRSATRSCPATTTPQWGLEVVVHPRASRDGVELALVRSALDVVREAGGGHLHLWVFKPTEIHDAVAHQLGLDRGRDLLHMRVPLPISEGRAAARRRLGPRLRDRPRRGRLARPQQPRVRASIPSRAGGTATRSSAGCASRGSIRRICCSPTDEHGELVGSNWTKLDHDGRSARST